MLKEIVQKNKRRIKTLEGQRIEEVLNDISRRMVSNLVRELLTPVTLDHNVQIKKIASQFVKMQSIVSEHSNFIVSVKEQLDEL